MKKTLLMLISVGLIGALILSSITVSSETAISDTASAIETLESKGVVEGFEDGELHPEYNLTRGQFAKILCTAFPDLVSSSKPKEFPDVDKSHWAYEYVAKASGAGLVEGFPDGSFCPDENVTYEQAVTVVCRALGICDNVSYPFDYLAEGMQYGITDRINVLIGDEINREQASRLILNAISCQEGQMDDEGYYNRVFSMKSGGGSSSAIVYQEYSVEGSVTDSYVLDEAKSGYSAPHFDPPMLPVEQFNTEEYVAEDENVFKDALTSPLSTFSIDTDTASYSNFRRFVQLGQTIPNGSVRIEEMLNYFDYEKAAPSDDSPFGVKYTLGTCPWNEEARLAMITVSSEELAEPTPSNIVFLIDTSGSMYDFNKLPLVKQSLSLLLNKLGENDTISIVTYASGTGVALEPTPATEKEKILKAIDSLYASGSTNGASGINLAYEVAEKAKIDGNNRVILCTDGDFNVGISSTGDLEALISEKRESGIFLSVLGFGMGNYKDNKMETLADCGNGNYAYIDTLKEAKKVLVDEMSKTIYTVAKDVKIQAEFNPGKVKSYRLVGYENRTLNNEDFANDTKDAGELGAGASVTVLYEIVPADGTGDSGLRYQTPVVSESDELMTVSIRYKKPEGSESILCEYPMTNDVICEPDEDFSFASAVAELGMILNNSEYVGSATYDTVIDLAREGIGEDPYGIRCELVQLVDLLRIKE